MANGVSRLALNRETFLRERGLKLVSPRSTVHCMNTTSSEPARSALHTIVNGGVSIAVLGACIFGYTLLGERARPARSKPPKMAGTVVATETLKLHEGPVSIASNGIVVPLREIRLATEVAGRVIEQSPNLRNGRMVAAGEVLIRLDPIQYELEVRRLQSQQSQESAELAVIDVSIENTTQLLALAEEQVTLSKSERTRADTLVQRQAASSSSSRWFANRRRKCGWTTTADARNVCLGKLACPTTKNALCNSRRGNPSW